MKQCPVLHLTVFLIHVQETHKASLEELRYEEKASRHGRNSTTRVKRTGVEVVRTLQMKPILYTGR